MGQWYNILSARNWSSGNIVVKLIGRWYFMLDNGVTGRAVVEWVEKLWNKHVIYVMCGAVNSEGQ